MKRKEIKCPEIRRQLTKLPIDIFTVISRYLEKDWNYVLTQKLNGRYNTFIYKNIKI